MGRADLGIAEILDDQNSFDRTDLWSKYLRQPNIDALFYFGPDARGQIGWVNNKPVVAQRDTLWAGVTDESTLIRNINSRPASPRTADGYTLVLVHCWTKSLSDIKTVVDGLGPGRRGRDSTGVRQPDRAELRPVTQSGAAGRRPGREPPL